MSERIDALPIRYFAPALADAAAIRAMAWEAFEDTFAHLYDPEPFGRHLDEVYGPGGKMDRDLADPSIQWLVAAAGQRPIGYAKLSLLCTPAPSPEPGAMELLQLYVLRQWHGQGVAHRLMEWVIDTARAAGAPEIYLAVFDHNERAKRFYARYGFIDVGHSFFRLGDRLDEDRVWRKRL